jgi:hypothetical protein
VFPNIATFVLRLYSTNERKQATFGVLSLANFTKKMWYLYTMEFYSSTKNEILSFAGKRMELENIILSEIEAL